MQDRSKTDDMGVDRFTCYFSVCNSSGKSNNIIPETSSLFIEFTTGDIA
jgi:hypothetical protein